MRLRDNAKSRDNTVLKVVCFNFSESCKSIIWGLPRVYNELRNICVNINPWCCLSWLLSLKTWCDPLSLCFWPPGWSVSQCTTNTRLNLVLLLQNWLVKILVLAVVCTPTYIPTNHMLQIDDYHVWCVVKRVLMWFSTCALLYFTHCSANSQCIFFHALRKDLFSLTRVVFVFVNWKHLCSAST